MKNLLKKLPIKEIVTVSAIVFIAIFVRFYNFSSRVTFGPEQAISLLTSADMIQEKFTLLGQENVQRVTSEGHKIYSGALFSYSLIPIQVIFNYDPILITTFFAALNIFTGLVLYFVARKIFSKRVATISMAMFLLSYLMIYHSLFIWILNYLPLIGILTFYYLYLFKKNKKVSYVFIIGLLTGVGFSLEYLYLFFAFVVAAAILKFAKLSIKNILAFIGGVIIPNLPLIIFDLKHGFYHFNTLYRYLVDVLSGNASGGLFYYDLLPLIPLAAIAVALFADRLFKRNKPLFNLFIFIYVFLNIRSPMVNFWAPTGMPADLTYKNIFIAAKNIADNSPSDNFNVAVLVDFDSRGHILRYPLKYQFGLQPKGVEDYSNLQELYVVAFNNYDFDKSRVWEVNAGGDYSITPLEAVGKNYELYKLSHELK